MAYYLGSLILFESRFVRGYNNNKLVLILTRHTLARAGLANRLLDRLEVVTDNGDVVTLRQATP